MKDLYSIGETAKLMGISVQTLRHYSKLQLINPRYINPETGYRYYSVDQFHFIDRLKYLQNFGLSLSEIDTILTDGSVDTLLPFLEKQKQLYIQEVKKAQETVEDIQWYIDYFKYIGQDSFPDVPYKLMLDKRYMVAVPCLPEESSAAYHIRLNEIKSSKNFKALKYKRQFSYIADFSQLIGKKLKPTHLGMFLKEAPKVQSDYIIEIPAGEYLCFRGRILTDQWNPALVSSFFQNGPKPTLVLANEYEDNLMEYSQCMYEVQILLPS
ncbi:helix-turn-helix domain-containing protein [Bacillus sp. 03113]|uniref:MerR family transcriptional regulator n=1 Tax=Bacillus sp. 03113 TaxID=2578211 RepID=UPI001141F889|nr:helix-turn-helix domain-containing protein [Bacillus sp. 03113]